MKNMDTALYLIVFQGFMLNLTDIHWSITNKQFTVWQGV